MSNLKLRQHLRRSCHTVHCRRLGGRREQSAPTSRPPHRGRHWPGLVPTGSTGEFTSLTPAEHRRVIEVYVEAAAGRVPVIAGVGTLTTQGTVELAQFAEKAGADAVMVVPPFYDPLDFDSLKAFLTAVSDAISVPIVSAQHPRYHRGAPDGGPDRRTRRHRARRLPQRHPSR